MEEGGSSFSFSSRLSKIKISFVMTYIRASTKCNNNKSSAVIYGAVLRFNYDFSPYYYYYVDVDGVKIPVMEPIKPPP